MPAISKHACQLIKGKQAHKAPISVAGLSREQADVLVFNAWGIPPMQ